MPGGIDGGTCSPETVTCPKKNVARDQGIELAPAASQPTP